MNDKTRIDTILSHLRIKDRKTLDVFIADGLSFFEGSVDCFDLQWDEDSEHYRIKTESDLKKTREIHRQRVENNPFMAKVIRAYYEEALLDPLVLPYFINNESEGGEGLN